MDGQQQEFYLLMLMSGCVEEALDYRAKCESGVISSSSPRREEEDMLDGEE